MFRAFVLGAFIGIGFSVALAFMHIAYNGLTIHVIEYYVPATDEPIPDEFSA